MHACMHAQYRTSAGQIIEIFRAERRHAEARGRAQFARVCVRVCKIQLQLIPSERAQRPEPDRTRHSRAHALFVRKWAWGRRDGRGMDGRRNAAMHACCQRGERMCVCVCMWIITFILFATRGVDNVCGCDCVLLGVGGTVVCWDCNSRSAPVVRGVINCAHRRHHHTRRDVFKGGFVG